MRLKLVLLTALLAAALGATVSITIIIFDWQGHSNPRSPGEINRPLLVLNYASPIIFAFLGSIFAYRHTARRRKLQAVLTGTLTIVFWLIGLVALGTVYSMLR
jgi:hypothetical protein